MDWLHDVIADTVGADRENPFSQVAIFYGILTIGGLIFYQSMSAMSFWYSFVYKAHTYYPYHTLNRASLWAQAKNEMWISTMAVPFMAVVMLPCALFSYRGYSRVYYNVDDYGWPYLFLSMFMFLFVTDFLVYWCHRGLHHPLIYGTLHKLHHTYKFTTPFSSHAFHPLDGFIQGCPYYVCLYLFPIHHILFVLMFIVINSWTISIHDQIDFGGGVLGHFLNSTGHHTIHHVAFHYNYGQYFTLWDRVGGTYEPGVQTHDFNTGKRLEAEAVAAVEAAEMGENPVAPVAAPAEPEKSAASPIKATPKASPVKPSPKKGHERKASLGVDGVNPDMGAIKKASSPSKSPAKTPAKSSRATTPAKASPRTGSRRRSVSQRK